MKKLFFMALILSALLALTACSAGNSSQEEPTPQPSPEIAPTPEPSEQPPLEDSVGMRHYFDSLGFSVKFPAFWEGKYGLGEFDVELDFGTRHFVEAYHIVTREEFEGAGTLFTLGVSPRDHYTYEGERPVMAGGMIFLAQTGGNTYFVSTPSGVEHSEAENSASAVEYLQMLEYLDWDYFVDSFRLLSESTVATATSTTNENACPSLKLSIFLTPENTVLIETNSPLRDFAWVRLSHDFVDGELIFRPSDEYLGTVEELLPGKPFVINNFIDNGSLPTNAVTFVDQYGKKRYFAFSSDNSLGLEPNPYMPEFFDNVIDGQVRIYATRGDGSSTDLGYIDVDTDNFDPYTWIVANNYRWAAHAMVIWELDNVQYESP